MSSDQFKTLDAFALRRQDNRGYLDILYEQGGVVLKRSFSKAGVFRGMHYQRAPYTQTKLIRVASGRILDFVVDPSDTPPRLHRRELGVADGWVQIDSHLAHGFYSIEDTEFEYLCLGVYNEGAELCFSIVNFLHDNLGLTRLTLSDKDIAAEPLDVVDGGLHI